MVSAGRAKNLSAAEYSSRLLAADARGAVRGNAGGTAQHTRAGRGRERDAEGVKEDERGGVEGTADSDAGDDEDGEWQAVTVTREEVNEDVMGVLVFSMPHTVARP